MKNCVCGKKLQKNQTECFRCAQDQRDFDYQYKIDEKRRWRIIDEGKRLRRESTMLQNIAIRKRMEEDRLEAEAERRRLDEQKKKMIAEAENQYENAIQIMGNDSTYDAEDEMKLKSKRSSKGFQRRRRKIRFPADEIDIREKYLAKIKVREFIIDLQKLTYFSESRRNYENVR